MFQTDMTVSGTPATASVPKKAAPADYEVFLRMLTTQMQNQNPLEPVEASDFAVQLATFSSVEQQTRTNQLLMRFLQQEELGIIGALLGRRALSDGPALFGHETVTLRPDNVGQGERAELILSDLNGLERGRLQISPDLAEVTVTPGDLVRMGLPPGQYQAQIDRSLAGQSLGLSAVLFEARVIEARVGAGGPQLVLENRQTVALSDVSGIGL